MWRQNVAAIRLIFVGRSFYFCWHMFTFRIILIRWERSVFKQGIMIS